MRSGPVNLRKCGRIYPVKPLAHKRKTPQKNETPVPLYQRHGVSFHLFRMQTPAYIRFARGLARTFSQHSDPPREATKTKRWIHGRMESSPSLSEAACVSTAKPPRLQASRCIFAVSQAMIVATSEIFSGRPFSRPPTSSAKQGELAPEVRL